LISAGHRYSDILNYSWPQFEAFCKAIDSLRKQELRNDFSQQLIATRGSEDAVKEHYQQLK